MRKTFVVATREYFAAVKTKSFLISLILLPIMMSGGVIVQGLGQKIGDKSTKTIAILDRTPGAALYEPIAAAVKKRNETAILDASGQQVRARFELEKITPVDWNDAPAADQQRLQLSNRVRSGELLAFVEIGPDLLKPTTGNSDARAQVHYSTNRPTYRDFYGLLQSILPAAVFERRVAAAGMSYQQLRPLLNQPVVSDWGLASAVDGKVTFESTREQLAPFVVPVVLVLLMFVVVMVGASPMTANIIEEKQLRIAEVLLGSLSPFELMMGKLLGGVGVALTLAAIYFGGAYWLAVHMGMAGYLSASAMICFILFTIVGVMMYGSMFVAAGAAVTNVKEAQTMIMPVMLIIVLPISLITQLIQEPSGLLAKIGSFFPFSAPMVMSARIAIPPGVPPWQIATAAGVSLATMVVMVWAAGRIFRVGILMQGKAANYAELARWIVRG
jgi:ABC-2 type transport system permease protein